MTSHSNGTASSGPVFEMVMCPCCLGTGDLGIPDEVKAAHPNYDLDGCPDCNGAGNVMVPPHVAEAERRIALRARRLGWGEAHHGRGRLQWS